MHLADTYPVVVGYCAGKHDIGAGIIIAWILQHAVGVLHHRLHQALRQVVQNRRFRGMCKVLLKGVDDNVDITVYRLRPGNRIGVLRIQNRKNGIDGRAVNGYLFQGIPAADDGVAVHLRARGRQCQDGRHRNGLCQVIALQELLPHIALQLGGSRNTLGAVNAAAAADGKDQVNILSAADLPAFEHRCKLGVGRNA